MMNAADTANSVRGMTYHFGKSFLPTYCVMREKEEIVRLLGYGTKGGGEILIQTRPYNQLF